LFFLLFATLLLVASFSSRRFVEYWPPFAVLFAAFALQPLLEGRGAAGRLPDEVMDELQIFFDRPSVEAEQRENDWFDEVITVVVGAALGMLAYFIFSRGQLGVGVGNAKVLAALTFGVAAAGFLFLLLAIGFVIWRKGESVWALLPLALTFVLCLNVGGMSQSIANDQGRDYYRQGAEWMRQNIPAGERVFNTDWDDFPRLFFFDPQHSYVSGLDPTYLYKRDPELSKLYESITLGKEEDPGPLIRDRFGARYVFTDNQQIHERFIFQALNSGWFDTVYKDEECAILKIRDQQGDPPEDLAEPENQ
jgi:hypothetical protein